MQEYTVLNSFFAQSIKSQLLGKLIYSCASITEGIKPSVLFNLQNENLIAAWKENEDELLDYLGLSARVFFENESFLTLFVYSESHLQKMFEKPEVGRFLIGEGYRPASGLDKKLNILSQKYDLENYPHEIGVFLGYPLNDVLGFITNAGKNYKLCRYWKVYDNVEYSNYIFNKIDMAKSKMASLVFCS